jgi:hypothetical protein
VCCDERVIEFADLGRLRLVAQRIAHPSFDTAAEVVRWMTCMQGQDYAGAVLSVALRTSARERSAVIRSFDDGDVVRSWPMRGTLHLVAAEDLGWMLGLTTQRLIAGAAARRVALGLDVALIESARELAVAALSGGRRLRRDELLAVWDEAGLLTVKQRSYHLIWHLAQTGTLCYGPTYLGPSARSEQCIVLVDEWVRAPRRLERDEALGEWALRYFRSHGPATSKDFAWWTKLTMHDVKVGLAVAKPQLERVVIDGLEYFMDPQTPALLKANRTKAAGAFLLPGFDEYLLGYQDRGAVLPPIHAARIVPGGNGMFLATVVVNGEVVGTWRHGGTKRKSAVTLTPFTAFTDAVAGSLTDLYETLP